MDAHRHTKRFFLLLAAVMLSAVVTFGGTASRVLAVSPKSGLQGVGEAPRFAPAGENYAGLKPSRAARPPSPPDGDGDGDGDKDNGTIIDSALSSAGKVVKGVQQIYHSVTIHFSYAGLMDALNMALTRGTMESLSKASQPIQDQAEKVFLLMAGFNAQGLKHISIGDGVNLYNATVNLWRSVRNIALAFLPLVFLANLLAYFSSGDLGPRAYIDALLQLALSAVFIVASLYLAHWVIRIGWGTGRLLASQTITTGHTTSTASSGVVALVKLVAKSFGVGLIGGLVAFVINPLIGVGIGVFAFYLAMFILFLAIMAIMAIGWASITVIALAVIVVVLSPLAIVVGQLPGFRWVYGMWIKVLVGVAVYPVLNAVLLQIWGVLAKVGGLNAIAFLIHLAMVGMIIAVNGWLAKISGGALAEAGRKAKSVVTGAISAAAGGAIWVGTGGLGGLGAAAATAGGGLGGGGAAGAVAGGGGFQKWLGSRISGFARNFSRNAFGAGEQTPASLHQNAARLRLAGSFMPGSMGRVANGLAGYQAGKAHAMQSNAAAQRDSIRSQRDADRDRVNSLRPFLREHGINHNGTINHARDEAQTVMKTLRQHPHFAEFQEFLKGQNLQTTDFVRQAAIARMSLNHVHQRDEAVIKDMRDNARNQLSTLGAQAKGQPFEDLFDQVLTVGKSKDGAE